MSPKCVLPFPRGQTASDSGLVASLDDDSFSGLEGRIFEAVDSVHSTGQTILLRAVKNDSGAAITVARKFCMFALTSDYDFGRRVSGYVDTAGLPCKPMDDAYTVGFSIPDDDIFWVVERGPCSVVAEASSVNLAAGAVVASDASGLVNGTPCDHDAEYAAGSINAASTTESATLVVQIEAGLHQTGT